MSEIVENPKLKSIYELLCNEEGKPESFFIPSYQRGYRWTEQQVKDLLNDIWEFHQNVKLRKNDGFYCLQPIVVKKRENGQFEVIDGQQRLTTIYLILYYINQGYVEDRRMKLFDLHYETRENSTSFLQDLTKETNDESNIDFYHISNAYKTICDWFSNPSFNINDFESKFKFNSKVIWYESAEYEPIAIFTRINIGKIPLTNAELIKALFLNSSNFDKKKNDKIRLKQLEISSEWDYIEQSLQNNRFWYFLNGNNVTTNRIEFIFELINDEKDYNDDYSIFRFFNKKFVKKNQETIEDNWLEVKKYFQRFQEWFEERDLYHKIGYLIAIESITIVDLYNRSINLSKTEFRTLLDDAIKSDLKNVTLESLQYGDKRVKKVLLLYNILTMLNNENDNAYFPFDIYKNEKWDIEHITSITDDIPKQKSSWLNDAKVFIDTSKEDGKELKTRADTCDCENDTEFEALFTDIVNHFNFHLKDGDINDISNLALLDSETNRGYKNAVFPLKRKTIIDREKKGTFIPICTKNVFLKYFSSYPPKISFWTQEDRDNYYKDLAKVLEDYIEKDI